MNQEEQKKRLKKKCDEVWLFAGEAIRNNEKVVDTQSLLAVIGLAILISKFPDLACDAVIFPVLKDVAAVSFVCSVLLCIFVPTWFVHRRRCLQGEMDKIASSGYGNRDGGNRLYTEQEIEEIERKYLGCVLPFPKIHILEFVRLICVAVCVVAIIIFLMYNTNCMSKINKDNVMRGVERKDALRSMQNGLDLQSQRMLIQGVPEKMDKGLDLSSPRVPSDTGNIAPPAKSSNCEE